MKTLLKTALLAGMIVVAPQAALAAKKDAPAPAASSEAAPIPGLGYADLEAAAANSAASRNAAQQRQTYYKAQIDQYTARQQQLQAQVSAMVDKYKKDSAAPGANQAALQQQAASIQAAQQNAQNELNGIIKPVVYSEAYVGEQIDEKLEAAVRAAMAAKKISLLLKPEATLLGSKSYDLTDDITAQLNVSIPNAQIVPPAGWEPRQIREARAQQAAAQGGAPAPAPAAGAAPTGR